METAYDFLLKKGVTKVHQPTRRYNLSIAELVEFLDEYATRSLKEYVLQKKDRRNEAVHLNPDTSNLRPGLKVL